MWTKFKNKKYFCFNLASETWRFCTWMGGRQKRELCSTLVSGTRCLGSWIHLQIYDIRRWAQCRFWRILPKPCFRKAIKQETLPSSVHNQKRSQRHPRTLINNSYYLTYQISITLISYCISHSCQKYLLIRSDSN